MKKIIDLWLEVKAKELVEDLLDLRPKIVEIQSDNPWVQKIKKVFLEVVTKCPSK